MFVYSGTTDKTVPATEKIILPAVLSIVVEWLSYSVYFASVRYSDCSVISLRPLGTRALPVVFPIP